MAPCEAFYTAKENPQDILWAKAGKGRRHYLCTILANGVEVRGIMSFLGYQYGVGSLEIPTHDAVRGGDFGQAAKVNEKLFGDVNSEAEAWRILGEEYHGEKGDFEFSNNWSTDGKGKFAGALICGRQLKQESWRRRWNGSAAGPRSASGLAQHVEDVLSWKVTPGWD